MTKKKTEEITAPVSLEEFETFVETWQKLKPVLRVLAPAVTTKLVKKYSRVDLEYHYVEGYHDITDGGVYFYETVPREWEEGYEVATFLIPLSDILDPAPIIRGANEIKAGVEKEKAIQQRKWDLANYERLRRQFEEEKL